MLDNNVRLLSKILLVFGREKPPQHHRSFTIHIPYNYFWKYAKINCIFMPNGCLFQKHKIPQRKHLTSSLCIVVHLFDYQLCHYGSDILDRWNWHSWRHLHFLYCLKNPNILPFNALERQMFYVTILVT